MAIKTAAIPGKMAILLVLFGSILLPAPVAATPGAGTPACRGSDGQAAAFGGRRVFLLRGDQLTAIKAASGTDPRVAAAIKALTARADRALTGKPRSVMDKTGMPPSGDRHDYMSIAPYWWPDPKNPTGPYVRRDGQVNPERDSDAYDHHIYNMVDDAETLALAYYYTGDARYAAGTGNVVRAWFLDSATRMNPNMNFAQSVPGRQDGRGEGVLDTRGLMRVIDAVGLIAPSRALTPVENKALEAWFSAYVDWMRTSPNGRDSRSRTNNHGLWYDAQIVDFALFARRPDIARATVAAFPKTRIAVQFAPNGALPEELTRTHSFRYSLFALEAAQVAATLGECVGADLWNYADAEGRGLRSATAFVAAYRGRPAAWPYQEGEWPAAELDELLVRASIAWGPAAFGGVSDTETVLLYRPQSR